MLQYNEILPKKVIELDGEPYMVLAAHVFRKQQGKPVNQTKLRSLKTGKVIERSFHASESVEEAFVERREAVFAFQKRDTFHFHSPEDKTERFVLSSEEAGEAQRYLVPGMTATLLVYNDTIIGVELPIKVELVVVETPPNVRGNTAQGGSKPAKLESGAEVVVPMFIEVGDVVRVNTQTGEYVERVEKAR
ncbi:elongation factor P [Candidatus Parcubacteria bacterium]|nr:MAG: elongation factor P [Candidatus Parcubacteria bacterium]